MKKLLCVLVLVSSQFSFAFDFQAIIEEYSTVRDELVTELNKRTNDKFLTDLKVITKDIQAGLSSLDSYILANNLFYEKLTKAARTQLNISSLGADLLTGQAVNTEGLSFIIPRFTVPAGFKFVSPSTSMEYVKKANQNLEGLIKKMKKTKRKLLKRLGGVSDSSAVAIAYDGYITKATRLKELAGRLNDKLFKQVSQKYSQLAAIAKDNRELREAVYKVAALLADAKSNFIESQNILKAVLKKDEAGLL